MSNSMIEIITPLEQYTPKILIMGIGGGGNNAIDRMLNAGLSNVNYIAINTDLQFLSNCKADTKLQIGKKLTNGYGAGADPSIGEASAIESEEEIFNLIKDADMVILTCGMGGGTGTGAIPVIAKICKSANILTIAVVTTPFSFESQPRILAAQNGIEELKKYIDMLLVIPNDKLLTLTDKPFYLEDAFTMADTILKYTIDGITNIIYNKGTINLDFNDLRTTLLDKGIGHLGIGTVDEGSSIMEAVKLAINSPLLDTTINGATNILINSSGHINLLELNEAISYVREIAGETVNIIWGTVTDSNAEKDKIVVTLIATGMQDTSSPSKNLRIKPAKPETYGITPTLEFNPPPLKIPKQSELKIPNFLKAKN